MREKNEDSQLHRIRHSAAHVMAQAVLEMFPEGKLAIGPAIEDGFYYDFDLPRPLTPDDLEAIQRRMGKIIDGDHEFVRRQLSVAEARQLFAGQPYKLELIDGLASGAVDEDGETAEAAAGPGRQGVTIRTDLPGCGSRLFVVRNGKSTRKPRPAVKQERVRELAPKPWSILLNEPNVLVLDCAEYRTDGGKWQPETEVLRIDHAIRDAAGFIRRGGQRLQPWATPPSTKTPIALELRFRFEAAAVPSGQLALAIERPEKFDIEVNGKRVSTDGTNGWWVDASIETVPLDGSLLRAGTNEIRLRTAYDEHDNLEAAFLLGDFGVKLDGPKATVIKPVSTLKVGNWVKQGLPFYSGAVTYRTSLKHAPAKGERVVIQLPRYAAACVRVLVDGNPAGVIAWPPHEVDVTGLLNGEKQELGIQVISSRRNSFGPLHRVPAGGVPTGPDSFATEGEAWTDEYSLLPYGLLAPPRVVVRR